MRCTCIPLVFSSHLTLTCETAPFWFFFFFFFLKKKLWTVKWKIGNFTARSGEDSASWAQSRSFLSSGSADLISGDELDETPTTLFFCVLGSLESLIAARGDGACGGGRVHEGTSGWSRLFWVSTRHPLISPSTRLSRTWHPLHHRNQKTWTQLSSGAPSSKTETRALRYLPHRRLEKGRQTRWQLARRKPNSENLTKSGECCSKGLARGDWGPGVIVAGDGGGVAVPLAVVSTWWPAELSPWGSHYPHTYMPFSGQISPIKNCTHITPKKISKRTSAGWAFRVIFHSRLTVPWNRWSFILLFIVYFFFLKKKNPKMVQFHK